MQLRKRGAMPAGKPLAVELESPLRTRPLTDGPIAADAAAAGPIAPQRRGPAPALSTWASDPR
eukprot:362519-Chlamydomonas_euryale.AAC.6